jgi:hypothetical protein
MDRRFQEHMKVLGQKFRTKSNKDKLSPTNFLDKARFWSKLINDLHCTQ